jgi:ribonuclease BN (tRNA processing enzyme)
VRLTILGSGTAAPNPRRGAPGYLVEAGDETILVECGAGTVDRLLAAGHDPRNIDHVLLTHHHLDHFGEIGHLLFSARLPGHGRQDPLTLSGSPELLDVFHRYSEPFGHWLQPDSFDLTFHDLDREPLVARGVTISGHPVEHIASSRALRFTEASGAVLVISGDTDQCDGIVQAARGADLFVCEASFPEWGKVPRHMVPSEAAEVARQAGVRRLLLTHFYPECDQVDMAAPARAVFPGPVNLAEDGMVTEVMSASRETSR